MNNLWKPASNLKWFPDADNIGAPPGVLLRADNTVPDKDGARSLRAGSANVYTGLQDLRVQSLHATELNGTAWLLMGAGNTVYANGTPLGATFDGSGDIVFGDDSYQMLAARGTVRKKWDGTHFHNWSIDAPILPPTLAAVNAITVAPASFDIAESPAFVINEGTSAFVAGHDASVNGALKLIPDAGTGRASASKKYVSDQTYFDIGGTPGGPTDLFSFRVWFEDWRKVDKVTIMFGLGTGDDPFKDDYYYFDFNVRDKGTVDIKDAASATAAAYSITSQKSLSVLTPQQVTDVRSAAQAGEILKSLGRFAGPRSTERRDALAASPAWGNFSVTRAQFNRVGGTPGKSWNTVRGFKVVYVALPGSTESVYFDDAVWTGGGSRSLTGTFRVGYRFARRFFNDISNEIYYELSPMSPISADVTLNQQALQVTIPATALAARDPQVGEAWVYLNGGWLDTYYRFAVLPATPQTGMTIDELSLPTGSNFATPEKRTRLTSWGFTASPGAGVASLDVVFIGAVSETEILIDNEAYTPGTMPVPINIVAIAGPWNGRMFLLDNQGYLHPTGKAPSNVSAYHALDLRRYGTPLWLAKTSSGVVAGFTKDIVRIAGTGDESDDRVIVDLYGDPLNVGNPPIDSSVMIDGNTVVYRAADGLMALSGNSLLPVPYTGTALLWRGQDRHGVPALNLNGRYRTAVDNHILYMLAPEASADPTAIWVYYFEKQEWGRHTYPFTPLSILREPSGRLYVGTTAGSVVAIEEGTQDSGEDIAVTITPPFSDGDNPLQRKDAVDLQLHVNTGGHTGTVDIRIEPGLASVKSVPFASVGPGVFRADITDVGVLLRAQIEITGSFDEFSLVGYNMTYRQRPQQVMALDLGYIVPRNGGDMAWLTEAEVDCISPVNLSILIYKDDTLWTTQPVLVTKPRKRSAYRVTLPRETKSRRLRLVVKTTNPAGASDPGFEPYGVSVRHRGSGNMTSLYPVTGDAA